MTSSIRSLDSQLAEDGYAIVTGQLSGIDIMRLRASLLAHFEKYYRIEGLGKHQPDPIHVAAELAWIVNHPAILATMKRAFASDDFIFTGNGDAHMNMLSWWHKDTSEGAGGCFAPGYFTRQTCRVFRIGIYLQDQKRHGLTVRRRSHHSASISHGEVETLQTNAGDIVIFDIRLTHAGQFADCFEQLLLRTSHLLRQERMFMKFRWAYNKFLQRPDKLSLFLTFGANGPDTEDFISFNKRQRKVMTGQLVGSEIQSFTGKSQPTALRP
jgi:hypothetical protein